MIENQVQIRAFLGQDARLDFHAGRLQQGYGASCVGRIRVQRPHHHPPNARLQNR